MEEDPATYIARIHASDLRAALVVTGGGSGAVHRLLACPGASRTVVEAVIPYGPAALARYLGAHPAQAVSADTATRLAGRALVRARRASPDGARLAGVACTAALATDRDRRGPEQAFVAVRTPGQSTTFRLGFEKGKASRAEQEDAVGAVILGALGRAAGLSGPGPDLGCPGEVEACSTPRVTPLDALAAGRIEVVVVEPDGRMHTAPGGVEAVLAGSLDPLHAGHLEMARAASRRLGRRVDFELSLVNADKSPVSPEEALARIQALAWRRRTLATRAPTFEGKSRLFPGCVFVVGFDTAARVVQEHFYGNLAAMLRALDAIRERGNRFLVAGREGDGVFLGLDDIDLPQGYEDLFEQLPARDFREDISSTEIRMRRTTWS